MRNRAFEVRAMRLGYSDFTTHAGRYLDSRLNEMLAIHQAAFEEGARAERHRTQMAKWGGRKHG